MFLAPLSNGTIFKKLFQEREILQAFVKDLIGIEIEPEKIEVEKRFEPAIGNIDIAFDIFADDPKHRLIVEMQRIKYDYHPDRFLHYFMAAILELAKSYRDYKLSRTVYTIVWLPRRVRDEMYQHDIITTCLDSQTNQGESLTFYNHKLYFLNPYYKNKHTPSGVADWMQLVLESIDNPRDPQVNIERDVIHRAATIIEDDGLSPQDRADLLDEVDYERHMAKTISSANIPNFPSNKLINSQRTNTMTTITQTQTQYDRNEYDSTEYNRELEKNANSPSNMTAPNITANWRRTPIPQANSRPSKIGGHIPNQLCPNSSIPSSVMPYKVPSTMFITLCATWKLKKNIGRKP